MNKNFFNRFLILSISIHICLFSLFILSRTNNNELIFAEYIGNNTYFSNPNSYIDKTSIISKNIKKINTPKVFNKQTHVNKTVKKETKSIKNKIVLKNTENLSNELTAKENPEKELTEVSEFNTTRNNQLNQQDDNSEDFSEQDSEQVYAKSKQQDIKNSHGYITASPNYNVNPKPNYPTTARKRGYQGTVILKVLISENGTVGDIFVEKKSGYEVLDNSAVNAVRNWSFFPAKKNGVPVASWVSVPIKFRLTSG